MVDTLPVPEPPLRCEHIALRPWGSADLGDLMAGAADPLVRRYRYSLPDTSEQGRLWLAAATADRARGERLELAVCAATNPAALGSISLWGIHRRNRDAMLSWWLGSGARGRGMATASVRLLAGWAFQTLGMARLAAHIEVANAASRRVAERCGFVCEGRLRSFQQERDGSRADCVSYSLLPGELRPGAG